MHPIGMPKRSRLASAEDVTLGCLLRAGERSSCRSPVHTHASSRPLAVSEARVTTYHYSQWDGTQSVFDIDEDDLLSRISEDLLAHGDLRRAMAELFQRGLTGHEPGQRIEGLHDLMDRLREQRQRQLERYNLDSMMDDLQSRLDLQDA